MIRQMLCIAFVLAGISVARATQPVPAPKVPFNPGPHVWEAQTTGKPSELKITARRTVYERVPVVYTKVVNGQKVAFTKTVPVAKTVLYSYITKVDGKNVRIYATTARRVPEKKWSWLLAKKTPIVVTYGQPIGPLFRRVLEKDVLNLVMPLPKPADRIVPPGDKSSPPAPRPTKRIERSN